MEKMDWVKELVHAEIEMEESGMVDFTAGFDPERALNNETIEFLNDLKASFVESASAFNEMKGTSVGRIKIYGISNTEADFMLFRNGLKLIFSMTQPGRIGVRIHHLGTSFMPGQSATETEAPQETTEDFLESQWGAFGDLNWIYQGQTVKIDYLVRYYMSRFVRESAK